MTPGQLCKALGKRSSVISHHLAKLRNTGLVRFKREPDGLMYWPKPRGIGKLMEQIERFAAESDY